MLMILTWFACSDHNKTFFHDISSTVLVSDETGQQLNIKEAEICQRFVAKDYDTTTDWTVQSEQCTTVEVKDGVAILHNWEGEYFGPDVTISLELKQAEEVYTAELIDNDTEVWCDNAVVTEVDEHNNTVTYGDLCSENYERYLLWSLVLPSELF